MVTSVIAPTKDEVVGDNVDDGGVLVMISDTTTAGVGVIDDTDDDGGVFFVSSLITLTEDENVGDTADVDDGDVLDVTLVVTI